MKRFQSILCASILTLATASATFAGTIYGAPCTAPGTDKAGTIYGAPGTIYGFTHEAYNALLGLVSSLVG